MADQIVITEKTSQAKDVRCRRRLSATETSSQLRVICWTFSSRRMSCRPGSAGRRSCFVPKVFMAPALAEGGNKAAKLKAIREALRTAKQVWLATDCDREEQLIGQEILEHYKYRGRGHAGAGIYRAEDSQTIRDAFGRAKPNAEYAPLYAAAVARRQADQIYNLSLTRTATVILGRGARGVIGVGRVKTPTLAIVCKRELEIRNFVPQAYFEAVATAIVASGQFQMQHAPQERIVRREAAQTVVEAARDFEGALCVRVEDKRQGPPKLHDLPSLQKLCQLALQLAGRQDALGKSLRELYDGQGNEDHHLSPRRGALSPGELDIGRPEDRRRPAGGQVVQRNPCARSPRYQKGRKRQFP